MQSVLQIDDYRDEIFTRLLQSKIYQTLKKKCKDPSVTVGDKVLALISDAVYYSYHRHKLVLRHMGEFTLHDAEHLFRVLKIMELLIPDTIEDLSIPEMMLLILAAFYHDIGMAPSENTVKSWLGIFENETPNQEELEENQKFARFCVGRSNHQEQIAQLREQGKYPEAELLLRYLVSEYIRITHAERSIQILAEDWEGKILYKDMDLTADLAAICKSHIEDASNLLQLDHLKIVDQNNALCLPFIGVLLRLSDVLDFDAKRTPHVLFAHLNVKHPISIKEWNKHRSVDNWLIKPNHIAFSATCLHPVIEATIRKFCSAIDYELISCISVITNLRDSQHAVFPSRYNIKLPAKIDTTRVKAKTTLSGKPYYQYRDTSFRLNKERIIDLLMGTKLYGQTSVALRELIQNSIDACLLRKSMQETWGESYTPEIFIQFDSINESPFLKVSDNGTGMDQAIIDKYYSNIGTSYYESSDFLELKSSLKNDFKPTSRFGIGILSCFMVSDSIEVETRRIYQSHTSSDPLLIIIEGRESIFYIKDGKRSLPGTTTILNLRKDHPWQGLSNENILDLIKGTIPFPPFSIKISINGVDFLHSQVSLTEKAIDSLVDHSWARDIRFRDIYIQMNGDNGIYGVCLVSILENEGLPVASLDYTSRTVFVDGEEFTFKTQWVLDTNRYQRQAQTLNVEEEGTSIKVQHTTLRESKSKIALHGIEIPMSLFAHWNANTYLRAKINWPICLLINLNIQPPLDINLNSARTDILLDEKWNHFEFVLAQEVFRGVKNQVDDRYWVELQEILVNKPNHSDNFKMALSSA